MIRDRPPSEPSTHAARRIAAALLATERATHSLQPTALVHEAWIRLAEYQAKGGASVPEDENHRQAMFAKVMRQVLVDHARKRQAIKRGGRCEEVDLDSAPEAASSGAAASDLHAEGGTAVREQVICGVEVLMLDDALTELAKVFPRAAEVVELRFFAGLTVRQTALAKGCSDFTVEKDWRFARAWLASRLRNGRGGAGGRGHESK